MSKQDVVKEALLDIEYNSDKIVEELADQVKLQPEHISYCNNTWAVSTA